jgi:hypothetical protein
MIKTDNKTRDKKSITIFIQGHGEIMMNDVSLETIPFKKAKNVTVLNIPGGVFIPGISDMDPNKMKIPANPKKKIPEIEIEVPQLDLKVLDYLHKSYRALDANHKLDKNFNVDKEGMKLNEQNIHLIYANSGIPYFHESALESISRRPVEPIAKRTPVYDKMFFLHPTEHEDCLYKKGCSEGNCTHKERELRVCPEYGITIVHSSVREDNPYTLSGLEDGNRLYANLNQEESRDILGSRQYSTYEYWARKLNNGLSRRVNIIDKDIRKISSLTSNENMKQNLINLREKLLDDSSSQEHNYEIMTGTFDIDKSVADMSEVETMYLPKVTLSELIDMFIDGMGYDHIYIIDPTCNVCELSENRSKSLFQLHSHNIREKVRTNKVNHSEFPIVKNYAPNRNTDDNAVYRVRNSYNTTRVKAMEKRNPTFGGKRKSRGHNQTKKNRTIKKRITIKK